MRVYKIVFSPTGGTQKVADSLAAAFSQHCTLVDLTDSTLDFSAFRFTNQDVCIVAVPSFGGRVPELAISHLNRLRGENAIAILAVAYGNRAYEDTLLELRDTLAAADFHCVAAVAAVAEHSIFRQFAAGRPDAEDMEELSAFAERIRQKLTGSPVVEEMLAVPGHAPYRSYGGIPLKPAAGKDCTGCGLCAAKCPAGAIPADHPEQTDSATCISCMRCIAICPTGTRSVHRVIWAVAAQKMKKACGGRKCNELFL